MTELAIRVPCSQQEVSVVERGKINTPVETLARIAFALDVPLHTLFDHVSSPDLSLPLPYVDALAMLEGLTQAMGRLGQYFREHTTPTHGSSTVDEDASSQKQRDLYQEHPFFVPQPCYA